MAKYYSINEDRIIIKPLAFLRPIGIALLVLCILMPFTTLLIMVKGDIQEIQVKQLGTFILIAPLLIACIPFFTYSCRKVIFDKGERKIYQRTIFGQKLLMHFDQVADIVLKATFGMAYYLKSKNDRYGKGVRISPSFTNAQDKSKKDYEVIVLTAIDQMLTSSQSPVVADPGKLLLDAGILSFYEQHTDGYLLKPKSVLKFLPGFLVFIFFACFAWYPLITGSLYSEDRGFITFVPLVPLFITLSMASKRIVFDLKLKQVRLYYFGLRFATYSLSDFSGFAVVRKTQNGIYSGTDVRMKFKKQGDRSEKVLTLGDFSKTAPIEPFLMETEFILNK